MWQIRVARLSKKTSLGSFEVLYKYSTAVFSHMQHMSHYVGDGSNHYRIWQEDKDMVRKYEMQLELEK